MIVGGGGGGEGGEEEESDGQEQSAVYSVVVGTTCGPGSVVYQRHLYGALCDRVNEEQVPGVGEGKAGAQELARGLGVGGACGALDGEVGVAEEAEVVLEVGDRCCHSRQSSREQRGDSQGPAHPRTSRWRGGGGTGGGGGAAQGGRQSGGVEAGVQEPWQDADLPFHQGDAPR